MSTVDEIKQALLAPPTPFTLVKGATALAVVKDRPTTTPAAYVLSPKDATAANLHATGPVLQRSERDIMVVYVCDNLSDFEGDETADQLESLKTFARGRLIGFVPSDMDEPITHVGGEIVQAVASAVWFEDIFAAPIYLKEAT